MLAPPPKKQEAEPEATESPKEPALPVPPSFEPDLETVDGVTLQRFVTTAKIDNVIPRGNPSKIGRGHIDLSNWKHFDFC